MGLYTVLKLKILTFLLLLLNNILFAYEEEDKLKAIITGKIAKFISWDTSSQYFTITIYKNQFKNYFDEIYKDYSIDSKKVKLNYIDNINSLEYPNILYIADASSQELSDIFAQIKNKKIVTISDIRGFAQKGGMIQIYEKNQKLKLRINIEVVKNENIQIKSSLLRISDITKGKENE